MFFNSSGFSAIQALQKPHHLGVSMACTIPVRIFTYACNTKSNTRITRIDTEVTFLIELRSKEESSNYQESLDSTIQFRQNLAGKNTKEGLLG